MSDGYDIANLWLNAVKFLIGLVFAFQTTLAIQLKMDMFENLHYVISGRPDSSQVQYLKEGQTKFIIPFLPLTIVESYDYVYLDIVRVSRDGSAANLLPDYVQAAQRGQDDSAVGRYRFNWPGNSGSSDLPVATFDLQQLLGGPPQAGKYAIAYRVRFFEKVPGEPDGLMHTWEGNGTDRNVINIIFTRTPVNLGLIRIVQGHMANYPPDLSKHQYTFLGGISRIPIEQTAHSQPYVAPLTGLFFEETNDGYARFWAGGRCVPDLYRVDGVLTDERNFSLTFDVAPNQKPWIFNPPGAQGVVDLYWTQRMPMAFGPAGNPTSWGWDLTRLVVDLDGEKYRKDEPRPPGRRWGKWMVEPDIVVQPAPNARIERRGESWYYVLSDALAAQAHQWSVTVSDGIAPPQNVSIIYHR